LLPPWPWRVLPLLPSPPPSISDAVRILGISKVGLVALAINHILLYAVTLRPKGVVSPVAVEEIPLRAARMLGISKVGLVAVTLNHIPLHAARMLGISKVGLVAVTLNHIPLHAVTLRPKGVVRSVAVEEIPLRAARMLGISKVGLVAVTLNHIPLHAVTLRPKGVVRSVAVEEIPLPAVTLRPKEVVKSVAVGEIPLHAVVLWIRKVGLVALAINQIPPYKNCAALSRHYRAQRVSQCSCSLLAGQKMTPSTRLYPLLFMSPNIISVAHLGTSHDVVTRNAMFSPSLLLLVSPWCFVILFLLISLGLYFTLAYLWPLVCHLLHLE